MADLFDLAAPDPAPKRGSTACCGRCTHWGAEPNPDETPEQRETERWKWCVQPPRNGYANADHWCPSFQKAFR